MDQSFVFRLSRPLVIDEFNFDRLHGRNCKDGLTNSSTQSAQHSINRPKVSPIVHFHLLELFKSSKSNSGFRNRTNHKNREATIQPKDSPFLDSLSGAILNALVLAQFLVQLQLGLDVFRGVGDADFNATGDATDHYAFKKPASTSNRATGWSRRYYSSVPEARL